MPPKPRFSKDDVLNAAYALLEERGMDAVVAREVGKRLGCTVAPIFTCFENMDELRAALHEKALADFAEAMRDCVDYFPAFKEFGLRWVRLAKEHPHLYSEIFLSRQGSAPGEWISGELWQLLTPILSEVSATFALPFAGAERVMKDMLVYVHGLAAIQISSGSELSEAELRVTLSRLCLSVVAGLQAQAGCLNELQLRMMFSHLDMIPIKKNELPDNLSPYAPQPVPERSTHP